MRDLRDLRLRLPPLFREGRLPFLYLPDVLRDLDLREEVFLLTPWFLDFLEGFLDLDL